VTGANLKKRVEQIMSNRMAQALNRRKKLLLAGAGVVAVAAPILIGTMNAPLTMAQTKIQSKASTPKFTAAAIRLCKEAPGMMWGAGASYSPGRMKTGCMPLAAADSTGLIQRAYVRFAGGHFHKFGLIPIKGGPDWLRSDLYSIEATAEGKPAVELMQGPMLQALLEERFGLRIHRDIHPGPVYELTVTRGGSRLKPFVEGSCVPPPAGPPPELPPGKQYCMSRIGMVPPTVDADGDSPAEFAQLLSVFLDRPVIDKSGLRGRFDMHLEFSADEATPGIGGPRPNGLTPAPDPNRPPIFTAIQAQLGLRLQSATGPVESLVINHMERPSAN
jgi:uncharacterized protein (TIGR03435 family)